MVLWYDPWTNIIKIRFVVHRRRVTNSLTIFNSINDRAGRPLQVTLRVPLRRDRAYRAQKSIHRSDGNHIIVQI